METPVAGAPSRQPKPPSVADFALLRGLEGRSAHLSARPAMGWERAYLRHAFPRPARALHDQVPTQSADAPNR